MAINGSGVRDTGRVMKISINIVIAHLKKLCLRIVVEKLLPAEKNNVACVIDEQWSFVNNKQNQ